jgi:RNase P subunit RPR2
MKKCSSCKNEKMLSDFNDLAHTKDGKQAMCKECYKVYLKAWAARRKEANAKVVHDNKVCLDCGLKKPISQFGKKSVNLDKHNEYCKPCWKQRNLVAQRKFQAKLRLNG